jgi:hypothetical protein
MTSAYVTSKKWKEGNNDENKNVWYCDIKRW